MDPITGPASTAQLSELVGEKQLGRDEFLKLLIAQLKHQDPLKPQDNAAFVAELAQFSSLEQSMGVNDRLDLLSLQLQGMSNSSASQLVGSRVSVRGSAVTLDGSGAGVPVAFTLTGAAENVVVTLRDGSGRAVRTLELGSKAAGVVKLQWDGLNASGVKLPAGSYSVSVEAKNAAGGAVAVLQETKGTVSSISYEKGYPVLTLDNGVTAPVSDLVSVTSQP